MSGWRYIPFDEAVEDVSGGNVKTKQNDYADEGSFAIVDQGKALIAGYTDDTEALCKALLPVVIFGDHTRCLKYVDFPFGMGADGVKVLRPRVDLDVKFLYHYLRQLKLPDGGYDRHFKYLKRESVPVPPLEDQRRIAAILEQAETLRTQRRAALAQLDSLTQSLFLDMFGDPVVNSKQWDVVQFGTKIATSLRNGLSPSSDGKVIAKVLTLSAITGDGFNADAWKLGAFHAAPPVQQSVDVDDFLICRGNGNVRLVGKGYFPDQSYDDVTFPDTIIAARINVQLIAREYLQFIWNSSAVRRQVEALARTTNGTFKVNQTMLESIQIVMPTLALQQTFTTRIQAIEALKATHRTAVAELDALFASLQQRAFAGAL